MRTLRKTKRCLNCDTPLNEVYNYCPQCGQQNDDKNVSFRELSRDLFENFFSFDSRLAHTFFPFFFKPGHLTNEFNKGRRFTYANPIRLYIIVSVFYFFILNLVVSDATRGLENQLTSSKADSLQGRFIEQIDTTDFQISVADFEGSLEDSISSEQEKSIEGKQLKRFLELKDDYSLSEQELFDQLELEGKSEFIQYLVRQVIRVYRRDKEHLASEMVKNLSLMMFIMIPVFALLLKLLYVRRRILYINHLIHTIHIHTFAFFIYGVMIATLYWWVSDDNLQGWLSSLSVVIVCAYVYFSFFRVYGQSWLKTLAKFWLTGFIYFYVMLFALFAEMFISFLLF